MFKRLTFHAGITLLSPADCGRQENFRSQRSEIRHQRSAGRHGGSIKI